MVGLQKQMRHIIHLSLIVYGFPNWFMNGFWWFLMVSCFQVVERTRGRAVDGCALPLADRGGQLQLAIRLPLRVPGRRGEGQHVRRQWKSSFLFQIFPAFLRSIRHSGTCTQQSLLNVNLNRCLPLPPQKKPSLLRSMQAESPFWSSVMCIAQHEQLIVRGGTKVLYDISESSLSYSEERVDRTISFLECFFRWPLPDTTEKY